MEAVICSLPVSNLHVVVLTRPDCVNDPDEAKPWQKMFRKSDRCFCVKLASKKELNLSWKKAREQEMAYFKSNLWSEEYKDPVTRVRLGAENLRDYLSKRLLEWLFKR
jgi:hypothetical protein